MTQLVKKAESSISHFKRFESTVDNQTEHVFFNNMLSSMRIKVQSAARDLRQEQKKHYQRLSDFGATAESHEFFGEDDSKLPAYLQDDQTQASQTAGQTQYEVEDQSEEIKHVVEGIKALTNILSQMNDVVIQQGTIVDRIDYNLEQASKHVKKGNKELTEVDFFDKGQANSRKWFRCQVLALLAHRKRVLILLGHSEIWDAIKN